MENAHPSRQCRSQPRTMIFEIFFTLVVLLITCTVVCPFSSSHTLIHHLFMLLVLPLRTTLLPSYPRNLSRTHSQVHTAAVSSESTFIPISFHPRFCFGRLFTRYFVGILTHCPNPPHPLFKKHSCRQVFISSIIYLPIALLPGY